MAHTNTNKGFYQYLNYWKNYNDQTSNLRLSALWEPTEGPPETIRISRKYGTLRALVGANTWSSINTESC